MKSQGVTVSLRRLQIYDDRVHENLSKFVILCSIKTKFKHS